MSFDKEIGDPYTLASLPQALSASTRTQASGVCSISGVKKRKRTEIAVGIDGEGILIYSLQNPQLVTSYALPPRASFTTPPHSLYRKGSSKTPSSRFTYAFVSQSTPGEKSQLVCFAEEAHKDTSDTVKTSYTPSNSTPKAIAIDSIPIATGGSAKSGSHDVLAVFDNADAICLSSDLETVRWVANLNSFPSNSTSEIEYISLNTAKAISRGLLRSRQDITALLNPSSDENSDLLDLAHVICVISRHSNGSRTLKLLQVQPRSPDLPTTHLSPLKHLLTWDLPVPTSLSLANIPSAIYSIHAANGALHLLANGTIITYDFTGTIPRIHSELAVPNSSIDSFLRISQDLVFATSGNVCRIFDVKYNSIQGLLSLDSQANSLNTSSPSKKRKHVESEAAKQTSAPQLIAYYVEIGLIVGIFNNELVGMQLGGTVTRKRVKNEGTLLIDALGKGINGNGSSKGNEENAEWRKWQERKAKLDKHASKGKIARFEASLAADLGIELEEEVIMKNEDPEARLENGVKHTPITNGLSEDVVDSHSIATGTDEGDASEEQLRKWRVPKIISDSQRKRYRSRTLYALNKIFHWVESPSRDGPRGALKVAFFPPNVFQWLLQTGQLTKESIRRAILEEAPENLDSGVSIVDGDIVKAIVDFDPELHILSALLNHSHYLPIGEVVQAVKLLMQGLDDQPKAEAGTNLLTNGGSPSGDDMDVDIASELEAASHEIDHALSILDHGLAIRSHTLRPALTRLHTFPAPSISSTLRSMLPRRDLESLIQLLHLEFRNGGWASPYDFVEPEDLQVETSSEDPDDHAVAIIASLLSCALDAIGAGAWLATVGSSSSSEPSEEIITSLQADTTEALNGFWEARYMRGLLSEFLRYASNLSKTQKPSNKSLEKQGKPFVLDTKPDELPILPLGGKPDLGVERAKTTKGGRKEMRSQREIGMLISKKVPKYSFEKIVI